MVYDKTQAVYHDTYIKILKYTTEEPFVSQKMGKKQPRSEYVQRKDRSETEMCQVWFF